MDVEVPFIGFEAERLRLRKAIERGQSLLVLGPRGCGKTRLLRAAIEDAGGGAIYVASSAVLHEFLVGMAAALLKTGHRAVRQALAGVSDIDRWLHAQTSVHLRGILWTAIEREPAMIVLDGVDGAGARNYRFLQRIYHTPGAGMVAAARDYRGLDALSHLYWDPRNVINVPAFTAAEAAVLFDSIVQRLHLCDLDVQEFRSRVLDAAKGNPGEIVEMCRLACDPRYRHGAHIKFAPLRIDAITKLGALH